MAKRETRSIGDTPTSSPRAASHRHPYGWYALAMIALVAAGIAYAVYDRRNPSWREEVRLSDGRVIWIKQKHEYYDNYGTSQSWVTFSLPEVGGQVTWHSQLTPQRVDVYRGTVYVFGFPRGDKQFSAYRNPKYYMVAFRWTESGFQRIPFLELPAPIRDSENVYSCVPARSDRPLSLEIKAQRWCPIRGDKWKFHRQINLEDYEALARFYAELKNTRPSSE